MDPALEKKKAFLIRLVWFLAVIGIAIFLCRKALGTLMPLLIALIVSLIIQGPIRLLNKKLRFPKGLAGAICVTLFYLILAGLLLLVGAKVFTAIKDLVLQVPALYSNRIEPMLNELSESIRTLVERFDPSTAAFVDSYLDSIGATISSTVSDVSLRLVKTIGGYAVSVPGFLLNVMITLIATVFIASDVAGLKRWILFQLNDENRTLVKNIGLHLSKTLVNYIRGYGLILSLTFVELCIGLWLIGIENWALISFGIALLDILPVVGCGTILIPWAIVCVFYGEYRRALFIAILYIIITVIRNFIEPKIVGSRVGLHPIVTLSAMVVGTAVFGPVGLLGLPITLALLVSLNEAGAIKLFKRVPETDEAGPAIAEAAPGSLPEAPSEPAPAPEAEKAAPPAKAAGKQKPEASLKAAKKAPVKAERLFGKLKGILGGKKNGRA